LHFGGVWPLIFKPKMSENVPKQSEKAIIPEHMQSRVSMPDIYSGAYAVTFYRAAAQRHFSGAYAVSLCL
jgi:hypothetical protein